LRLNRKPSSEAHQDKRINQSKIPSAVNRRVDTLGAVVDKDVCKDLVISTEADVYCELDN